ncbi:MAG: phenylalanine--tRNA ligase subunit beta [Pirellulales bacterium]
MLVAWDWLSQYVLLDMSPDELALKLALSGLNHESTQIVGSDTVIDLEVTSNRGDCLGHIGIAREVAALYGREVCIPAPTCQEKKGTTAASAIRVENQFPEGCPRYTARVIRGVKIGPSPEWMVRRLQAIGLKSINNVVDATNYVMMECGQPLHAFDYDLLHGQQIIVRPAKLKETFEAIDHRTYTLDPSMVVIADRDRAVALGGVMGGAQSEVSDATVNVLIEAADFTPMAIRKAARALRLHSPSSYRFERKVDPMGLDWASRRCCQLILEMAGGELLEGMVDTSGNPAPRNSITLRRSQILRVLGIEVPWEETIAILKRLGCEVTESTKDQLEFLAPSWRHDLTREIDLIEEIARIHGYDRIPENVLVPMTPSSKRPKDVMLDRVRSVLISGGFDEALTPSIVTKNLNDIGDSWNANPSWTTQTPLLEGATFLRRSLVPSLLQVRLFNQSQSQSQVNLFETAVVYLGDGKRGHLPSEQVTLGMVSCLDLRAVRGLIEEMVLRVAGACSYQMEEFAAPLLADGSGLRLTQGSQPFGWMGLLHRRIRDSWKLDGDIVVAELNLDWFIENICLVPRLKAISPFPAIVRDLNLVVDESLRWQTLERTIVEAGGPLLSNVEFREIYRDAKKDGESKKRVLFSVHLQSASQTLTSQQADESMQRIVASCEKHYQAKLLA